MHYAPVACYSYIYASALPEAGDCLPLSHLVDPSVTKQVKLGFIGQHSNGLTIPRWFRSHSLADF